MLYLGTGLFSSRSQFLLGNRRSLEVPLAARPHIFVHVPTSGVCAKVAKYHFAGKGVPKCNLGTRKNNHSDHRYVVHVLACSSGRGTPRMLKREQHTFSARSQVGVGNGSVLQQLNPKKGPPMKLHLSYAKVCCLLMALLFAAPVFSQSNIPQMINYQGYLTDAEGMSVGTDTFKLSFSIYPAVDATTPVWGPKVMENVPVVDGHFNVILGPTDGATDTEGKGIAVAFTGAEAYLGVKVEKMSTKGEGEDTVSGVEIAPRQRILSTPYAMQAEHSTFEVPIGAIIPWIPPDKTKTAEEQVPRGFKICSGPATTDDSSTPFDETRIPKLTDDRFLMGGSESNIGKSGGANTIADAGAHTHSGKTGGADGHKLHGRNDNDYTCYGDDHTHSFTTGSAGSHSHGENRPQYSSVLMIIRVY